jgi:hypothetical protein
MRHSDVSITRERYIKSSQPDSIEAMGCHQMLSRHALALGKLADEISNMQQYATR